MKRILKIVPIALLLIMITSCVSVRVASDYDKGADFNYYK